MNKIEDFVHQLKHRDTINALNQDMTPRQRTASIAKLIQQREKEMQEEFNLSLQQQRVAVIEECVSIIALHINKACNDCKGESVNRLVDVSEAIRNMEKE